MIEVDRFPMTEPMRILRGDYLQLHLLCEEAKNVHQRACDDEAEAEYAYAKSVGIIRQRMLGEHTGYNIATATARDNSVEKLHDIGLAKAAKENAGRAMTLLGKQLEVLTAAFHAHNREVRTLEKQFVGDMHREAI